MAGKRIKAMMSKRSMAGLIAALILLALLAGCTTPQQAVVAGADVVSVLSGEVDEGFARAVEPVELQFPRDHGAHPEFQTEWWYYTGNLADAAGNEYGYQLTFFRRALSAGIPKRASDLATNQVYMAHFAISDVRVGRHDDFERFSRGAGGLAGAGGEPLTEIWLEDWSVRETERGVYRLVASDVTSEGEPIRLDLTLRSTRPPVLHGEAGLSRKGPEPGNANYYYSLVGLDTAGVITRGDSPAQVFGTSWMDHEFGTSALGPNALGWDWLSLQLDDGSALMLARLRLRDGGVETSFESTWLAPDGAQVTLSAQDFTLEALDQWTSPHTGILYPSGWRLTLPAQELTLTITPLLRDQEMQTSYVYWEGAVRAEGEREGQRVSGRGYVELTGYGGEQNGSPR